MRARATGEGSPVIRRRVCAARLRQQSRLAGSGAQANAHLSPREVRLLCGLTPAASDVLDEAYIRLRLTARACDRVVKVAQTIADLEGAPIIDALHVREGLMYRSAGGEWARAGVA
jgi:magnesium chelatase family protein